MIKIIRAQKDKGSEIKSHRKRAYSNFSKNSLDDKKKIENIDIVVQYLIHVEDADEHCVKAELYMEQEASYFDLNLGKEAFMTSLAGSSNQS